VNVWVFCEDRVWFAEEFRGLMAARMGLKLKKVKEGKKEIAVFFP